jgi:hypothetical protein
MPAIATRWPRWTATDNHVFVHGDIGDRELVARLLADHRPTRW